MELWEIGNILKKRYESKKLSVMKKYNLTSAEIDVLSALNKFDTIKTSAGLTNICLLQKSHISLAINSLLNKEYLIKKYINKKSFKLIISKNANQILNDINLFQKEFLTELYFNISKDELETYNKVNHQIITNIESLKEKE